MWVKVFSVQHGLEMAVVPRTTSPQPLGGTLKPSCIPYWPRPFWCGHWTSGFKTVRKMPNNWNEHCCRKWTPCRSLEIHSLWAGWQLGRHSSLLGTESRQKGSLLFGGKGLWQGPKSVSAVLTQKVYVSIYRHNVFVFTYQWCVSSLLYVQNTQKKTYAVNSDIA